eukprot:scaffold163775_cov32-Tisochrysis_lutea.AAC.3
METWKKQGPGASLGTLQPFEEPAAGSSSGQSYKLTVSSEVGPVEYAMKLHDPPGEMYSFVPPQADSQSDELRLEGKIQAKGDLNATQLNVNYKNLVRGRQENAAVRPELQAISHPEELELGGVTHRLQKQGELNRQARDVKKRKEDRAERRANEAKRVKRLTKEELRDLVFEKFEAKRYWHKTDLANALGQKPNELGPILDELCDRIKFGAHKQEYELKAQFGGQGAA